MIRQTPSLPVPVLPIHHCLVSPYIWDKLVRHFVTIRLESGQFRSQTGVPIRRRGMTLEDRQKWRSITHPPSFAVLPLHIPLDLRDHGTCKVVGLEGCHARRSAEGSSGQSYSEGSVDDEADVVWVSTEVETGCGCQGQRTEEPGGKRRRRRGKQSRREEGGDRRGRVVK